MSRSQNPSTTPCSKCFKKIFSEPQIEIGVVCGFLKTSKIGMRVTLSRRNRESVSRFPNSLWVVVSDLLILAAEAAKPAGQGKRDRGH